MASDSDDKGLLGGLRDWFSGDGDEADTQPESAHDGGGGDGLFADAIDSVSELASSALRGLSESDPDHDDLTTKDELKRGTDPLKADSDLDGLDDLVEYQQGSDPLDPSDVGQGKEPDGLGFFEDPLRGVARVADAMTGGAAGSFATGIGDAMRQVGESDPDFDGVPTATEIRIGTDPNVNSGGHDSDGDGVVDGLEMERGTDPGSWDTDGDKLSDLQENQLNTNPTKADTDGDGRTDFEEIFLDETNPRRGPSGPGRLSSRSSRRDDRAEPEPAPVDAADDDLGESEGANVDDLDFESGDRFSQTQDDDFDGIPNDMDEMGAVFAASFDTDSDRDGLTDVAEARLGTDPHDRDTDGDKMPDLIEVRLGTDPLVADPMPAEFIDLGPSDGTERGDLSEGMGKAESILKERDRSALDAALAKDEANPPTLEEPEAESADSTSNPLSQVEDDDLDGLSNDMETMTRAFTARNSEGKIDLDRDGLSDVAETKLGTDPSNRDTDGDEMPDLVEVMLGTDPLVSDAMPERFADLPLSGTAEGMGKVDGILADRIEAMDQAVPSEEVLAEVVVEDSAGLDAPEDVDTFEQIDASVEDLQIGSDDFDN